MAPLTGTATTWPAEYAKEILGRAVITATSKPCIGCKPPSSINNKAFFALFAILGVVMVVGGMWFFFWAQNGGFRWHEGDWDDYKSTVLRRKDANGKSLVGRSTKVSSASVESRQRAQWAAKSVIGMDERGRKGILGQRGFGKSHSYAYTDNFTNYDGEYRDDITLVHSNSRRQDRTVPEHHGRNGRGDVNEYRKEKVAKVGGMNREAEGSNFEFTNSDGGQSDHDAQRRDKKRARAEAAAREESERMDMKWRKESERIAALIAKERALRSAQANDLAGSYQAVSRDSTDSPSRTPSPRKREQRTHQRSDRSSGTFDEYNPRTARVRQTSPRKHVSRHADEYSMPGSYDAGR